MEDEESKTKTKGGEELTGVGEESWTVSVEAQALPDLVSAKRPGTGASSSSSRAHPSAHSAGNGAVAS